VAAVRHDTGLRLAAKESLKRPAVTLTGLQARAVGRGFAEYSSKAGVKIWACAILPDHTHLVLAPHRLSVEQLVTQLNGAATRRLAEEELHPFGEHANSEGRPAKCFARGEWKVFLNSDADVRRAIRYVELNPVKDGLRPQKWSFVTPYV
jgi:REP element-mobilizing transposase RayT